MLTPRGALAAARIDLPESPITDMVLIGGGCNNNLAELYNETRSVFEATAHCLSYDRYLGAAATPSWTGGSSSPAASPTRASRPASRRRGRSTTTPRSTTTSKVAFVQSGETMQEARRHHTATLLQDGTVFIAGGEQVVVDDDGVLTNVGLDACEIYDPAADTFTDIGSMGFTRYKHTATLLLDGRVLLCGGANRIGPLESCEIFDPVARTFTPVPHMEVGGASTTRRPSSPTDGSSSREASASTTARSRSSIRRRGTKGTSSTAPP